MDDDFGEGLVVSLSVCMNLHPFDFSMVSLGFLYSLSIAIKANKENLGKWKIVGQMY